jgi:hypothetical protein
VELKGFHFPWNRRVSVPGLRGAAESFDRRTLSRSASRSLLRTVWPCSSRRERRVITKPQVWLSLRCSLSCNLSCNQHGDCEQSSRAPMARTRRSPGTATFHLSPPTFRWVRTFRTSRQCRPKTDSHLHPTTPGGTQITCRFGALRLSREQNPQCLLPQATQHPPTTKLRISPAAWQVATACNPKRRPAGPCKGSRWNEVVVCQKAQEASGLGRGREGSNGSPDSIQPSGRGNLPSSIAFSPTGS